MGGIIYNAITLGFVWIPLQVGSLGAVGIGGVLLATVVGGALAGWLTKLIGDGLRQSGGLFAHVDEV